MESEQLPTQGEIFKDEILAGTERTNNPAEQVPDPYDHGKNLSEMTPTETIPKSLILQVHDVLMNHRYGERAELQRLLDCLSERRSSVRQLIEDFRTSSRNPFPNWNMAASTPARCTTVSVRSQPLQNLFGERV